jgi:hypothetical protein
VDAVERYLLLGLRLGRHVDGLVDFYYGPDELSDRVRDEPVVAPAELASEAVAFLASLDGASPWLFDQVRGLVTYANVLAGEEIPYSDEVQACYGVRPEYVSEERFAAAHVELDAVLPGKGSLVSRFEAWRESQLVPTDGLVTALERCVDVLRARTTETFGLPEGESCTIDTVDGAPWLAFNYYLGELRSRITVNVDLPIAAPEFLHFAVHETYPGHHTEHVWKEQRLVRDGRRLEESIALIPTPQAIVSEGIAELGCDLFLTGDTLDELAGILRSVGVPYDGEQALGVARAREPLAAVVTNAALMVHESGVSEQSAAAYVTRWGLIAEPRASRVVSFLVDPTWRAYATTYSDGLRLCRGFAGSDLGRFRRLLTEQVTVDELVAAAGGSA